MSLPLIDSRCHSAIQTNSDCFVGVADAAPFLQRRTLSAGETLKASRYIFQVKTIRRILVVMLQLSITLSVVAGSMKERLKPSRHCCSFLRCSKSATQKRGPSISRATGAFRASVSYSYLQLVWAHFTATAVFFFTIVKKLLRSAN